MSHLFNDNFNRDVEKLGGVRLEAYDENGQVWARILIEECKARKTGKVFCVVTAETPGNTEQYCSLKNVGDMARELVYTL